MRNYTHGTSCLVLGVVIAEQVVRELHDDACGELKKLKMRIDTGSSGGTESSATRHMRVTGAVAFYFVCSLSLVFLNKFMFSSDKVALDAPLFLTWTQVVVAVGCIMLISSILKPLFPKTLAFFPHFEYKPAVALQVAPLTAVFVGMIVFNNLCLKHVEVSFYQVARSLTIVFNVVFTYFILHKTTSRRAVGACGVVVVGYLLGVDGEVRASSAGIFFGVTSSMFVCLYSVYVKKMLALLDDNQWLLMIYNNVNAMLLMPVVVLFAGEVPVVWQYERLTERYFLTITLVTGMFGFLINIASFLQIKVTSPLTHNVSGTAKACVQTVLGALVYQNPVSGQAALGTALAIFGCGLYSVVRFSEMDDKKSAEDKRRPARKAADIELEEKQSVV